MSHERIYHRQHAQRARANLALLHHRQDEMRAARRSIPLQDPLVDEALFELRESAAYAAYLETIARDRDVLQGMQTPDLDIVASTTTRAENPKESINGESV